MGSNTDSSKDGAKDTVNDTNTVKDAANKDAANKDATNKDTMTNKDTTKNGGINTEAGNNRGRPDTINTAVSAQSNDGIDLLKGENNSGKQSPIPKGGKKGGWGRK